MTAAGSWWNSSWEPLYLKNSKQTALETEWVLFPLLEKVLFNVQGQCLFLCMTHMDTLIYSSDALFQNSIYFELTMGALIRKLVKLHHFSQEWNVSVLFLLVIHILHQQETWLKILNRYWKKQFSFFLIRSDIHTSSHFLGTKEWHAGCYRKQEQVKKKMQVLCPLTNWKTEWRGLIFFFFFVKRENEGEKIFSVW